MTLQELLQNLPAFFDRDPQSAPALRVRHADGLRWQINDTNTLRLWAGTEDPIDLDLTAVTLGDLAADLLAQGFEIPFLQADLSGFRASILLPGRGDQNDSNGDHLTAYTSILWAHLQALTGPLDDAQRDLEAMQRQLVLPQAREAWADHWGDYFGVPRNPGEADGEYTQRIIQEVYRPRNNRIGMQVSAAARVPAQVNIFEPWRWMFRLSYHRLSHRAALPGQYYQYHVLHPWVIYATDWEKLLRVLNQDRPAGSVLWSMVYRPGVRRIDLAGDAWPLHGARLRRYLRHLRFYRGLRLSVDLIPSLGSIPITSRVELSPHLMRTSFRVVDVRLATSALWTGDWDDKTWLTHGDSFSIGVNHSIIS